MNTLSQALRGAAHQPRPLAGPLDAALVVGGGGTLGSALLAEALVAGRFRRVAAVVAEPLASALRAFVPLPVELLQDPATVLGVELAFIVFERARHSNRRDDAFLQPAPADLLPLATRLRALGVRRLVVVVPHAAALLPHALKSGLATLDEAAVAALGFDHLVFVRAAATAGSPGAAGLIARFAGWWLSQLRWMVPQREQPLRAVRLAALVVGAARRLRAAPPGTRVLPPDVLWQAALDGDGEAVIDGWLLGGDGDNPAHGRPAA